MENKELKENMEKKLTKQEYKTIECLISYYSTLGKGDNDNDEDGIEEDNIYHALIKLRNLHDENYA